VALLAVLLWAGTAGRQKQVALFAVLLWAGTSGR
jgi:hypothetical protein